MSIAIIASLIGVFVGSIAGYYVRYIVALSKKKSLELDIKQVHLEAKEEAQTIIEKAEKKAGEILEEVKKKENQKEADFKQNADRLFRREEQIDKRQQNVDTEIEKIKQKTEELQVIKQKLSEKEAEKEAESEE